MALKKQEAAASAMFRWQRTPLLLGPEPDWATRSNTSPTCARQSVPGCRLPLERAPPAGLLGDRSLGSVEGGKQGGGKAVAPEPNPRGPRDVSINYQRVSRGRWTRVTAPACSFQSPLVNVNELIFSREVPSVLPGVFSAQGRRRQVDLLKELSYP